MMYGVAKNSVALVSILAMILMLFGCSGKSAKSVSHSTETCQIDGVVAPEWVCSGNGKPEYVADIGSAPYSKQGVGFSRREAMANARSNLVQQIQADVKDKVETFSRSIGIGTSETADKVSTQVSKQVAHMSLSASKQVSFWQNPKTSDVFVLVAVDRKEINSAVRERVLSSYRSDDALWQQFQAKRAQEALEHDFSSN